MDDRSLPTPPRAARASAALAALAALAACGATTTLVVAAGAARPLRAQPAAPVGWVDQIGALGDLTACRGQGGAATGLVRRRRAGRAVPLQEAQAPDPPPGEPSAVLAGDTLTVGRGMSLRLQVRGARLGRGVFVFAPRLLCPPARRETLRVAADTVRFEGSATAGTRRPVVTDTGTFAFGARAGTTAGGARDELQLFVFRGVSIIDWVAGSGPLVVVSATGHPMRLTGTRIVVAVDGDARTGLLHVAEGTVRFEGPLAGPGGMDALAGQWFYLRQGQRPEPLAAGTAAALRLTHAVQEGLRGARVPAALEAARGAPPVEGPAGRRAFWQRPPFWIATGAVVAGVGGYCVGSGNCWGRTRTPTGTGTVIIRVPF